MTQNNGQYLSVTPYGWETLVSFFAMLPFFVVMMAMSYAFKIIIGAVSGATEIGKQVVKPESLREIRPIAEKAVAAKGGYYLPGGE